MKDSISRNAKSDRTVVSVRISNEIMSTFTALCLEAGITNRSQAFENILAYLVKPTSIETTKAIITTNRNEEL